MSTVVMNNVVSLDGFIADLHDDPGPLFEWYFNGDRTLAAQDMDDPSPGGLRVSASVAYDYVRPVWDSIGCMVIGRHLFDITNGWEGRPPTGDHVVVVSHRPGPEGWHPEASYHFVDDVPPRSPPRGSWPATGRCPSRRATWADRPSPSVSSTRWPWTSCRWSSAPASATSAPVETQHLLDDPDVVVQGDRVLHLRFTVRGPRTSTGTAFLVGSRT